MLTKTDFIKFLNCQKSLWLKRNIPEAVAEDLTDEQVHRITQGHEVEAYARQLFDNGKLVTGWDEEAEKETQAFIDEGATIVFQGTAIADVGGPEKLLAKVDILEKKDDGWVINEVKSSSSKKEDYIKDIAFQRKVFEEAGYNVVQTNLIILNKDYVKQGKIEPQKLLQVLDVTHDVNEADMELTGAVSKALEVIGMKKEPRHEDLRGCCKFRDCPCFEYCFPDADENSIFELGGIRYNKVDELMRMGVENMVDIPPDFKLSKKQEMQIDAVRAAEPLVDKEAIKKELDALEYPLYFLDYESFNGAIPLYDGYHPFEQTVFQYSLHVIPSPGAEVQHFEYLADGEVDPAPEVAKALAGDITKKGTMIAWYQSFEKGRNKELGKKAPEFADFFADLNTRVFDLMDIFKKQYYVHPGFKGSSSIKNVLPVMVPELSHADLEISNGGEALVMWHKMVTGDLPAEEKQEIHQNLLEYCKLDTWAMVRIYQELLKVI